MVDVLGDAVVVEAVLTHLVVALVMAAGVAAQLVAVGMGFAAGRGGGQRRQCLSVVFFKAFTHCLGEERVAELRGLRQKT